MEFEQSLNTKKRSISSVRRGCVSLVVTVTKMAVMVVCPSPPPVLRCGARLECLAAFRLYYLFCMC